MNIPEPDLRRIKVNAALTGQSMVRYVRDLVQKDEKRRKKESDA